jgi:hypothetical protein
MNADLDEKTPIDRHGIAESGGADRTPALYTEKNTNTARRMLCAYLPGQLW